MLFHVKRVSGSTGILGYEWLDILAFQPIAIMDPATHHDPKWAKDAIMCDIYARTPDGFAIIRSADLGIAQSADVTSPDGYEYYMAEKG